MDRLGQYFLNWLFWFLCRFCSFYLFLKFNLFKDLFKSLLLWIFVLHLASLNTCCFFLNYAYLYTRVLCDLNSLYDECLFKSDKHAILQGHLDVNYHLSGSDLAIRRNLTDESRRLTTLIDSYEVLPGCRLDTVGQRSYFRGAVPQRQRPLREFTLHEILLLQGFWLKLLHCDLNFVGFERAAH